MAQQSPRLLDARPDRVDYRDRPYQPPLRSLPDQYPPVKHINAFLSDYRDNILNQGREGACTGFGLAALINYIYWERWILNGKSYPRPPLVSAPMLYKNAQLYDEWEGEDYEGSSCRGAMKGWHKNGVSVLDLWPSSAERPQAGWDADAPQRPLGAYYRVDAKSVLDIQAAICEVHAVYAQAKVHSGWDPPAHKVTVADIDLPVIDPNGTPTGGHAFALVGYTRDGFIVQNSWGPEWGFGGFALLTYEDWIANGNDAWVAAIGAPMSAGLQRAHAPMTRQAGALIANISGDKAKSGLKTDTLPPWTEQQAYEHAIVMGNDGKLIRRLTAATTADDNLKLVVVESIAKSKPKKIAVYVHGGLNSEEDAISRARRLGPWFERNDIYPLFVVWRTGVLESIGQIGEDQAKKFEEQVKQIRARGFGDLTEAFVDKAREAFDRSFEVAAEKLIGKAVWSQMKQNAAMAAREGSGLAALVQALTLAKAGGAEIHLLGHSAGSIMIGHMLEASAGLLDYASCGLYAPACTTEFAVKHYGDAFKNKTLAAGSLHIDLLTDAAERDDSVGPYGKSLLYLVSRALEDGHKTPVLGLDIAWTKSGEGKIMKLDEDLQKSAYAAWSSIKSKYNVGKTAHAGPKVVTKRSKKSEETIDIAHGSFDNDLAAVTGSLTRILGAAPKVQVTDLTGF